jgi:UDPglucose 6-dehydrogenase
MTPWPEFSMLSPAELATRMAGKIAIDPYRLLDAQSFHSCGFELVVLGA